MFASLGADEPLVRIAGDAIASLCAETLVADALSGENRPATVLALGKAADEMLKGATLALGDSVVRSVCAGPSRGSHPTPDTASLEAGEALLAAARSVKRGERLVALVSGGGSSLAVALPLGVALEDKRDAFRELISSGLSIDDINVVRKHISALKGGQLAVAARGAELMTMIISDVVSGDPSAVGSGPTVADSSSFNDALRIAQGLTLPDSVRLHLEAGARGEREENPTELEGGVEVLADNRALVAAAEREARVRELAVRVIEEPLVGDPGSIVATLMRLVRDSADETLLVGGGESTPRLPRSPGRGGRAQHLALMLAEPLSARPHSAALVVGSDGVDGESGGAGGRVTATTVSELAAAGIDVKTTLARFDSATALEAIGGQLPARRTGTNLADLVLVWTGGRQLR